jgi:hypothetical protein
MARVKTTMKKTGKSKICKVRLKTHPADVPVRIETDASNKLDLEDKLHDSGKVLVVHNGTNMRAIASANSHPVVQQFIQLNTCSKDSIFDWHIKLVRRVKLTIKWDWARLREFSSLVKVHCTVNSRFNPPGFLNTNQEYDVVQSDWIHNISVYETDNVIVKIIPEGIFLPGKYVVGIPSEGAHVARESTKLNLLWNIRFTPVTCAQITDGDDALRTVNCSICMSKLRNALLVPCHHVPCCMECAYKMDDCPMCRVSIKERLPVILSRAEMPLIGERMMRSEAHSVQIAHVRRQI